VLRRRLLLVLFALGTNMGIKRIVATGGHGESERVGASSTRASPSTPYGRRCTSPTTRHQALFVALAHHPQRGRLEVDVGDVESGNL
jgi:hypothetical protein